MSESELLGSLMSRFKAAKEKLAQKRGEMNFHAQRYEELAAALRQDRLPDFELRMLPNEIELIQLRDDIDQALKQIVDAKQQLASMNIKVD